MSADTFTFWKWFLRGDKARPGWLKLFDRWLVLHIVVGWALGRWINTPLMEAGQTVLLPLAGVLVGLSFAWAGNAQALLQSAEIEAVAKHNPGGLKDYVYTFQTSVLILLATIVVWGLAALGLADVLWPGASQLGARMLAAQVLYGLTSLTLRECWQVVMASQWLVLMRHAVRARASRPPEDD